MTSKDVNSLGSYNKLIARNETPQFILIRIADILIKWFPDFSGPQPNSSFMLGCNVLLLVVCSVLLEGLLQIVSGLQTTLTALTITVTALTL